MLGLGLSGIVAFELGRSYGRASTEQILNRTKWTPRRSNALSPTSEWTSLRSLPSVSQYEQIHPSRSRRSALRTLAIGAAALSLKAYGQDGPLTIFFYSPETNVNNFSLLKGEFDAFLANHGGHKFQPFSSRKTFEEQMANNPHGLFLLSSWHYRQLAGQGLEPLLIGQAKGRATQKHELFSKGANPLALKGLKIASAGSKEFTEQLLRELLPQHPEVVASMNVLVVPKDIDALMAVSFGVAQAAVATENGAEKLARLNPRQRDSLKTVGVGRESLLPVLVGPNGSNLKVQALLKVLQGMNADFDGRRKLRFLGLDGFRALDPEQKESLKK
jgi:hypothetical protein